MDKFQKFSHKNMPKHDQNDQKHPFLGSGPRRGRIPVEWGEIPFVRPSVTQFDQSSFPLAQYLILMLCKGLSSIFDDSRKKVNQALRSRYLINVLTQCDKASGSPIWRSCIRPRFPTDLPLSHIPFSIQYFLICTCHFLPCRSSFLQFSNGDRPSLRTPAHSKDCFCALCWMVFFSLILNFK